jgi:sporulation protein YtfJ
MDKIKQMVDVNTIIGDPITSPDGTIIIPVSKVSYGFASGGSDFPTKKENKDCFGGGSGAGVTIQPVAFLTVFRGEVKLIPVEKYEGAADRVVGMMPELVDKVSALFKKDKKKKTEPVEINSEAAESDEDIF